MVMRLGAAAVGIFCPFRYIDRLQKEKAHRPLNWKKGPVLQCLSWFVTEATQGAWCPL